MDPRTRMILFKMINRDCISEINGCISTGKEANVYHATPGSYFANAVHDIAIKIYKTSILTFKDRDRYVTGEFRLEPRHLDNILRMCSCFSENQIFYCRM